MPKWIAIGEAAKYLGISRDTLRRWEKAGRIKPYRSPTNRRYYTKEQLDQSISEKPKRKKSSPPSRLKENKVSKLVLFAFIGFLLAIIIGFLVLYFLGF